MKWIPTLLIVALLFLGALYLFQKRQNEVSERAPEDTEQAQEPTDMPSTVEVPQGVEDAVREAIVALDEGVAQDDVVIYAAEERTWNNGCLGLAREGEMCTQALVEGYAVYARAGEVEYVYRSNLDGSQVRLESKTTTQ